MISCHKVCIWHTRMVHSCQGWKKGCRVIGEGHVVCVEDAKSCIFTVRRKS
jgi:hypothetical protein